MKQLYEGMYIISATLSEDARKKAIDRITSSIEGQGGEIHNTLDWGRRKLAYSIKKRKEGFYYLVYFTLDSGKMPEIWDEYRLNEDLIRYMTSKTESVKEEIKFKPLKRGE